MKRISDGLTFFHPLREIMISPMGEVIISPLGEIMNNYNQKTMKYLK